MNGLFVYFKFIKQKEKKSQIFCLIIPQSL